jgi:AcrR family transcriptional regulator
MTSKSLNRKRRLRPSVPRWQRRKESRPDEIIAAALTCFIDRGFSATLLDDVAARAGIAKGTLYRYFESKEELFRAVVRANLVGEISAAERELAASQLPSAELLSEFIHRMAARIASPAGALPHVVFAEAARFPDLARFYFDEVITRGLGLVELLIKRGIAAGEFRQVDVRSAAFCIIAPLALETLFRHGLEPHAKRSLGVPKLTTTLGAMSVAGLLKQNKK